MNDTLFLVAFFKFKNDFDFERLHLHAIFRIEQEARENMNFCDEAGWYEGILIEERKYGHSFYKGKRIWFIQDENGLIGEIEEPTAWNRIRNLIG